MEMNCFVICHELKTEGVNCYYSPPLIGGGIKQRCCLTSVTYIGPKSRTERPKTRIGTEVAHVTRDSDTTFKDQKVKVTRPLYSPRR